MTAQAIVKERPLTNVSGSPFIVMKAAKDESIIAGYCSVPIIDKQRDLITIEALRKAADRFMKSDYRNVQIQHSNVQVGEVIESWRDSSGRLHKTAVDENGFYVVVKLRRDIEKAKEVIRDIKKGRYDSFSIGGEAIDKHTKYDPDVGTHDVIDDLELYEVTICEEGMNQEAKFDVLKEDKKMDENEVAKALEELNKAIEEIKNSAEEELDDNTPMDENPEIESTDLEAMDTEESEDEDEDEEDLEYSDEETKGRTTPSYGYVEDGHNEAGMAIDNGRPAPRPTYEPYLKAVTSLDLSNPTILKAFEQFLQEKADEEVLSTTTDAFNKAWEEVKTFENTQAERAAFDALGAYGRIEKGLSELREQLKKGGEIRKEAEQQAQQSWVLPKEAFTEDGILAKDFDVDKVAEQWSL